MHLHSWSRKGSVFATLLAVCLCLGAGAWAQSNPTGTLSGVVLDPSGKAVPAATVLVISNTTGQALNIQSDAHGRFVLGSLSPDSYNVKVARAGFQTATYRDVTIQVGQVYTLNAKLTLGEATQTVEVQAGQQVLATQTAGISGQVSGKEITEIPISSRNAQDLATFLPSVQTTTTPRQSQFEGLPSGAINITFDGINSQDQVLKSSTSSAFFSTEQPRIDDVQEMNVSTAAASAADTGEGAVQVNIVSKKGTNQFHGGVWEYMRNNWLNANYYFNNNTGLPRQILRLNEYGYKIGGPILKNKLFFFTDMDIWSNPQGILRTRDILTSQAALGQYTYTPKGTPAAQPWLACGGQGINAGQAAGTCTADLFQMMTLQTGQTQSIDPVEAQLVNAVSPAALAKAPGVSFGPQPGFNQEEVNFNSNAASRRYYPDLRLDYNINSNNSLEYDLHYDHYFDGPDILNGSDASYPVAPYSTNVGSQISNRTLMALAWRSQFTPTMNNELRIGGQSSPLWFEQGLNLGVYPLLQTDDGTLRIQPNVPSLMTNPLNNDFVQGRNASTQQLNDTLSWLHGNHAMTMGATYTHVQWKNFYAGNQVASVTLGLVQDDPQFTPFTAALTSADMAVGDLTNAENLYGVLGGRMTAFNSNIYVNPSTRQYQANFNNLEQISQNELGLFFADSWHLSPALTFSYGLRWQYEGTPVDDLGIYSMPQGGAAGVYGVSGYGNLFNPGSTPGAITTFVNAQNQTWYKAALNNWAPSLGLAWTPSASGGLLALLLGHGGQSVLRGGYSIAYDRQGLSDFEGISADNPGYTNNAFLQEAQTGGGPNSGTFTAGSLFLGSQSIVGDGATHEHPASYAFGQPFQIDPTAGQYAAAMVPGLAPPLIESWQMGFQRQLNANTAFEVRYVGNHSTRDRATLDLNEANIFENGFLTEFNQAKTNLNACLANTACSAKPSFANNGLPGQGALPIMTAAFGSATSSFRSGGFITDLKNGQAGAFANSLATNYTDWQNLMAAGYPSNFFVANPYAAFFGSHAYLLTELGQSTYNGLQLELRRRMADGVQFNANYTWSHSLGTGPLESLRNYGATKAPSPSDLRQVFKFETLWQLPFGEGHRWNSNAAWINTLIGGWEWDDITRWQSGNVFQVTGGNSAYTVNHNNGGVQFNGASVASVQSQLGVLQQSDGRVFYAPTSLLGNGEQQSNFAVMGPCQTAGSFCQQPYFYGPSFFKTDFSLVKTTKLSEGWSLVLTGKALDLFNNINFLPPTSSTTASRSHLAVDNSQFMRITSAYQDFTSTQDPGGRVIEIEARIVF